MRLIQFSIRVRFKRKIQKNHLLSLGFLILFLGLSYATPAHAFSLNPFDWVASAAASAVNVATSAALLPFNLLLFGIYTMVAAGTFFAGVLMDWAINPTNFLIVADNAAVYEVWKFVRDLMNLVFIMGLLFAAFATIFQISGYKLKDILIKIVVIALLVNFSFPISRAIIDVANVLFYGILSLGGLPTGAGSSGQSFSASFSHTVGLAKLVAPNIGVDTALWNGHILTAKILLSIIFLFMYTMTLLIIASLFIIRIVVLTILIILSPAGFVAALIPGMAGISKRWWGALLRESFFAPGMALGLVLATRIMAEFNNSKALEASMEAAKGGGNSYEFSTIIVSGATMFIPIVIMWVVMNSSKSFGATGSAYVMERASGVTKWSKEYALKNNPVSRGVRKGAYEGKAFGLNYGNTKLGKLATGKYWNQQGPVGAATAGFMAGGFKGARTEQDKVRRKQVEAKAKEDKENMVSWSEQKERLKSSDVITRQAAAVALADNGGIQSTETMYAAIEALKDKNGKYDQEYVSKIIDKAKGDSFDDISKPEYKDRYAALARDKDMYLTNDKGQYVNKKNEVVEEKDRIANDALEAFNSKIKKEGELMVRVNFDAEELKAATPSLTDAEARTKAVEKHIGGLNADDLAKQGSMFGAIKAKDEELITFLKSKAANDSAFYGEAMKKMKQSGRETFFDAGIVSRPAAAPSPEAIAAKEKLQARNERAAAAKANKPKPVS